MGGLGTRITAPERAICVGETAGSREPIARCTRLTGVHAVRTLAVGIVCAGLVASGCGGSAKSPKALGTPPTTAPSSTTVTSSTYPWQNPRIHTSVELAAPNIVSGERVPATLIIENDSGAPIVSNACVIDGESVLGTVSLQAYPPPTAPPTIATTTAPPTVSTSPPLPSEGGCRGPLHVVARVGTTRVPFMLEASSSLCQLAPAAQLRVPVCLPGGTPLRAGTYYVDPDWYGPLPVPPVTVPVVASS